MFLSINYNRSTEVHKPLSLSERNDKKKKRFYSFSTIEVDMITCYRKHQTIKNKKIVGWCVYTLSVLENKLRFPEIANIQESQLTSLFKIRRLNHHPNIEIINSQNDLLPMAINQQNFITNNKNHLNVTDGCLFAHFK